MAKEQITGHIEHITFHNEENGFCVLRVKVPGNRQLVTVIGHAAAIGIGEFFEAQGIWVNDKTHGLQFKAESLTNVPPTTLEGIEKYLGSGSIRGIGPFFAKKLIAAFNIQIFDIFEKQPNRLTKIAGIGEKRKKMIITSWNDQKYIRNIMIFLQSHGIGITRAIRIYKTYGEKAIQIIQENPYRLAEDIFGIGFKSADGIAQSLGIAKDSLIRAHAGVRYVLQEFCNEGHCAAPLSALREKAIFLLEIPESIINTAIEDEIKAKNFVIENIQEQECVFLSSIHNIEVSIAKHIKRLKDGALPWGIIDAKKALPWVETVTKLKLSTSQQEAITKALNNKITIITGGPGVGKTTIVNSLLKIVLTKNIKLTLCAPTGRAAKRITETTKRQAKTIHRLLGFDPKSLSFKHNTNNPLDTDLVVIDEASMIDIALMNNLLKAIPDNAALLLVGDTDQLPSVGPGALLSDMIKSQVIPTVELTEIFRQAGNSKIIINAHRINQGKFPYYDKNANETTDFYLIPAETPEDINEKLLEVVTRRIPNRFGMNSILDVQVLSPMNKGALGTASINISLQEKLNGNANPKITKFGCSFAPGDKIIQNVNNYDKDVYNGDIGFITKIDLEDSNLEANFEGRIVKYDFNELDEISLAYAISIHKSQGSEYPAVVIPISTQHYVLLARNLIYTGVTRGKKLVVIIGQTKALAMAIRNAKTQKRLTNLKLRLQKLI